VGRTIGDTLQAQGHQRLEQCGRQGVAGAGRGGGDATLLHVQKQLEGSVGHGVRHQEIVLDSRHFQGAWTKGRSLWDQGSCCEMSEGVVPAMKIFPQTSSGSVMESHDQSLANFNCLLFLLERLL